LGIIKVERVKGIETARISPPFSRKNGQNQHIQDDNEVFEKRQTEVGYSIPEANLSGIVRKIPAWN